MSLPLRQKIFSINPLIIALFASFVFIITIPLPFFFQDDWYHIYQIQNKSFPEVLSYFNLWQKNTLDPLNFYRPLSTKLYFFIFYKIYGLNPLPYFLNNAIVFIISVFFFSRLAKKFVGDTGATVATLFYSFSLVNFTFFSYITKIEDLLFALFTFTAIYSFSLGKDKWSLLCFIAALFCRESALIIPIWLIIYLAMWKNLPFKKIMVQIFAFLFITLIYLPLRIFTYGWPRDNHVYLIEFGGHIFQNLFKYLQWNLNLTGLLGLTTTLGLLNKVVVLVFLLLGVLSIFHLVWKKQPGKIILLGIAWWLIFLLPILFFRQHRDPWNLVVASGGLSIILAKLWQFYSRVWRIVFFGLYLLLFFFGLNFYSQKHWTVERANLVKKTKNLVFSQCQKAIITFSSHDHYPLKELEYSWYYDLGPKILCKNANLKVVYD